MDKVEVLTWLERHGTRNIAQGMARYGIQTKSRVIGVSMGTMLSLAKRVRKDLDPARRHALAAALWATNCYEARMVASLVDDPLLVTRKQMNAWTAAFDNWGICDTVCFKLFDQTPFAFEKAQQWAKSPREFIKRTGFVLMACLAGHDKTASDAKFLDLLPLIEQGARDERNFVKKGVSWALRMIGRRSLALNKAALAVAKRLAESDEASCRWVGKDALRELSSPRVRARLARKAR
jgi:3-methyladenine DNA glycosylase AlkD